ncbi:hypothetical protein EJB05_54193, partial [Eragrostis curvula]
MSRKRQRRSQREAPPLPLDLVLEIATRSDPTTLVRCAATCKDVRRRITDQAFHGSLRLHHADGCLVPSLLRGHLVWNTVRDLLLIDNATKHATKLPLGTACWPRPKVLAARDGLILIITIGSKEHRLYVFSPTKGHIQFVPHQRYDGQYVLLAGDDDDNVNRSCRSFRVVKVKSVSWNGNRRVLQFQPFFSEDGRWGRSVKVPIPYVHGGWFRLHPLVTNGALHWLCRSDKLYYIVKLHVESAMVTTTELPMSFHQEYGSTAAARKQLLLATKPSVAGSRRLCVFAADSDKISVWAQSERDPSRWTRQPQMEIKRELITLFGWDDRLVQERMRTVRLEWFSDRSGSMLFDVPGEGCYMLDVRSKKIVGWSWGRDQGPHDTI